MVLVVAGMIAVQIADAHAAADRGDRLAGETLKEAILHRAAVVVREAGTGDPYVALRNDGGLRSILESAVTSQPETNTILYAAIVDTQGIAVAHSTPTLEGQPMPRSSRT